ncbi:MAG: response regulator transcription factor [Mycoplasmatota bacterium]|nr:response regulator transcription factor [Mycoplasmatota bacterium]
MKILIVDDEKMIRDVIKEYCLAQNFLVDEADNGKVALNKLLTNTYDLMVLDIMMPQMDGFTMLKELPRDKRIPVIVLSARGEEYDKLAGFDLGIDDYLTKPFSPNELIARIKAIMNRYSNTLLNIYKLDSLEVNFSAHYIKIDKKQINVTPKEFEILSYLIKNKGIAISREQLLSSLWGYDYFGDDRTVDTHIKMLRNNLGKYRDHIVTVRGVGYKFIENEEE